MLSPKIDGFPTPPAPCHNLKSVLAPCNLYSDDTHHQSSQGRGYWKEMTHFRLVLGMGRGRKIAGCRPPALVTCLQIPFCGIPRLSRQLIMAKRPLSPAAKPIIHHILGGQATAGGLQLLKNNSSNSFNKYHDFNSLAPSHFKYVFNRICCAAREFWKMRCVPEAFSVDIKAVPPGADIVCSCVKMYYLNIGLRTNQHRFYRLRIAGNVNVAFVSSQEESSLHWRWSLFLTLPGGGMWHPPL